MPTTKSNKTTTKVAKTKATSSKTSTTRKVVSKKATEKKVSKPKAAAPKTAKAKATVGRKKKATASAAESTAISSTKLAAKKVSKDAEPHALDDAVTEKVRELIHLSREQGFLTYRDVDKALPKIADQPEELQNVISIFNNLEIKLLDSKDVEKFKKKKEESEEETARSNQSDMLDDPVRMYLKQMGKVPLLSREEEVDISKRIESAETAALKIIYSVSLTNDFQLEICKKLLERE